MRLRRRRGRRIGWAVAVVTGREDQEESDSGAGLDELLRLLDVHLRGTEERLRQIDPQSLYEARGVGRKGLPTTVIGLLVHLAEHTQRHLGQAITTIKMLRDTS